MGLLSTAAKAAVASSVHGRVQRRQQQRWAEEDQRAGQTGGLEPPTPPGGGGERLAQLKQLGELRETGVLTDAEFEAEKARILQQ
jgi:Short C-terminal domain